MSVFSRFCSLVPLLQKQAAELGLLLEIIVTPGNSMPDKNILAILYEEISKDPREALRITALKKQAAELGLHREVLVAPGDSML